MKYKNLLNEIAKLLQIDSKDLDTHAPVNSYGNWDSLVVVSSIALIDQEYNILLNASEIETCQTMNDIFKLIELKQQ